MIHHVSIPVRDPAHVAGVLAELTGWTARPFMAPVPGSVILLSDDENGTAIELYPLGVTLKLDDARTGQFEVGAETAHGPYPFHFLWSLDLDPDAVLAMAKREGWKAVRCWRGPPHRPLFELIELWIENAIMVEIATPAMLPDYLNVVSVEAYDRLREEVERPPQPAPEPA
ncbi:MAG TPA: hypothetical protein VLI41_04265 [Phenylobacterium sp.]|uniref:hypothetical protein n=1 Tax=Phenylobacterium sp. TaxID=1871053 RepID=UPI002C18C78E|nr:hypothetical protein [Phenylobacterium sp.]HSV02398.1 hypothetical protein [Phenylobacterium sp.]